MDSLREKLICPQVRARLVYSNRPADTCRHTHTHASRPTRTYEPTTHARTHARTHVRTQAQHMHTRTPHPHRPTRAHKRSHARARTRTYTLIRAQPTSRLTLAPTHIPTPTRAHIDENIEHPWRLRLSFAMDGARALGYLHARSIIHRCVYRAFLLFSFFSSLL